ncbi:MAG: FIST N-terminal domain-containing protein [Amaricoccus sp.]
MADRSRSRLHPKVVSVGTDPGAAVREIRAGLRGMTPALVLLFAAEGALLAMLTAELHDAFWSGRRVLGCSSAGGFAFGAYRDDRMVAIAFPAATFRAEAIWLRDLRQHLALDWIRALRRLAADFSAQAPSWSRFGLLMIDGLCRREELVAATVDAALGDRRCWAARPATGRARLHPSRPRRREPSRECVIFRLSPAPSRSR